MKKIYQAVFIALFFSCAVPSPEKQGADAYRDFYDMVSHYSEGKDYTVEVLDRASPVTVFAIHGGRLEAGTSLVAEKIAGKEFNLYVFNALSGESRKMHITASHFNDKRALALAAESRTAVSVHGRSERDGSVCVGGADGKLSKLMAEALSGGGYPVEYPCRRLPGVSPQNIVNRTAEGGVQLEISVSLLEKLDKEGDKLLKFTDIVKGVLSRRPEK